MDRFTAQIFTPVLSGLVILELLNYWVWILESSFRYLIEILCILYHVLNESGTEMNKTWLATRNCLTWKPRRQGEEWIPIPLFILILLCWYHTWEFSGVPASFANIARSKLFWKPNFKFFGALLLYLAFRGPPDDSGSLTGDHSYWFRRQFLTTCLDCHCSGCQGLVAGVRGEVGSPHKVQEVDLQMLSSLGIKLTSDQGNYRVLVTMVSIMGVKQTAEADPGTPLSPHPRVVQ